MCGGLEFKMKEAGLTIGESSFIFLLSIRDIETAID